jgi:hypothetical protein
MPGGMCTAARTLFCRETSCDGDESEIGIGFMVFRSLLALLDIARASTRGPAIAAVSIRSQQKTLESAEVAVSVRQKTRHETSALFFFRSFPH